MQADTPANELERLATLRDLDLLDTDAEPEFDELVALAAALCSTPIGIISLIDEDRQWFKAAVGLSCRETPRSTAFCAYAILQESVFNVEDATTDHRFFKNPMVVNNPNIRFYAGIPISAANGLPLGTLCVCDTVPRRLTSEQRNALEVLGRQVNVRLELRTQRKTLQQLLVEKQEMLDTLRTTQSQLEKANQRLEYLASRDVLTGMRNRRVFEERLADEHRRSTRRGIPLCVAILDIDDFKMRNDRFGHDAGDSALQQLAVVLETSIRQTDLAVRYGGEEFAILLPDTGVGDAQPVLDRILDAIRSSIWQHSPLTASIGLAEFNPASDLDLSQVMKRADIALYAAKDAGKNCVCCAPLPLAV